VLVGMPGAGKTAVGRAAAERMGREFADTDQAIEAEAGIGIPEIFRREGEAGFRARERAAIAHLAAGGGRVIATGGGAPLQPENAAALRGNGVVVHLRRPVNLLAVEGRPLSAGGPEALSRMLAERGPAYARVADRTVDNDGPADEAARRAVAAFEDAISF